MNPRLFPLLIGILACFNLSAQPVSKSEPTFFLQTNARRGYAMCPSGDGNIYLAGRDITAITLYKMTPEGTFLFSRLINLFIGPLNAVSEIIVDSDGKIVGCGNFNEDQNGNGFLFRYDPVADTVIWAKTIEGQNTVLSGIHESEPGGDYVLYDNPIVSGETEADILAISRASGDILPGRSWRYHSGKINTFQAMARDADAWYATGSTAVGAWDPLAPNTRSSLTRLDPATGKVLWSVYSPADAGQIGQLFGRDLVLEPGYVVSTFSGNDTGKSLDTTYVFLQKTSTDGAVVWVKRFDLKDWDSEYAEELVRVSDGYVLLGRSLKSNAGKLFLLKTDPDGNLQWARKYDSADNNDLVGVAQGQLLPLNDYLYFTGYSEQTGAGRHMLITKTDASGKIGSDCGVVTPTPVLATDVVAPLSAAGALEEGPSPAELYIFALPVPELYPLDTLFVCRGNDATGCQDFPDLGPDVVTCSDTGYTFHAGAGFVSYTWQDGSTNPDFHATTPGIYWVEVTDTCGFKLRDSVFFTFSLLQDTKFPDVAICPGESVSYAAPGFTQYAWAPASGLSCTDCPGTTIQPLVTTQYYLTASDSLGCILKDTFIVEVLPQPTVKQVFEFCPGDSIVFHGTTYYAPAMLLDTLPAATGCDTLVSYQIQYTTLPATALVHIVCPADVSVVAPAGSPTATVSYADPAASTDCPCGTAAVSLENGLASGADFPVGPTLVCYRAADDCGVTASCCFTVTVENAPADNPCDVKITACVRFEILGIVQHPGGQKTYRIRVTNNCAAPLQAVAFQLPDGITGENPVENTIYTTPAGRPYNVRNPNYTPFYSIRFKPLSYGISGGQSDVFEYTLPPQADPTFIHAVAELASQPAYETHLNVFGCTVQPTAHRTEARAGKNEPHGEEGLHIYPNPASDRLFIGVLTWKGQRIQLRITDVLGNTLLEKAVLADSPVIQLTMAVDWPDGMYTLTLTAGDGTAVSARFMRIR